MLSATIFLSDASSPCTSLAGASVLDYAATIEQGQFVERTLPVTLAVAASLCDSPQGKRLEDGVSKHDSKWHPQILTS